MKKIILFILTLTLSILFIKSDVNVYADSSSPVITWYEAIITNPKGAKTYASSWNPKQLEVVIPYNSEVIVLQEHSLSCIMYNNKEYWISNEDFTVKSQDFSLENASKLDEKKEALTRYEMNVYSGPSSNFQKKGTLPKDTEFSYEYVIKRSDSSWYYWGYVEHENIKGWIQIIDDRGTNSLAYKYDATIKFLENYENEYLNITISKGTVLNCFAYYQNGKYPDTGYLVEYNGNKIWIVDDHELTGTESIFEIIEKDENTTIPETPSEDNSDQDENLPNNQDDDKLDFYTVLYLSIGAFVLVSLTALATIILMNKKYKKESEKKVETSNEIVNTVNPNQVMNSVDINKTVKRD